MSRLILPLIIFCLFIGCKKNHKNEHETEKVEESRLKACECDAASVEYIKAEFNGIKMCFDKKWDPEQLFTNMHYYNPDIPTDQLNLIRQNVDRSFTFSLYFRESRIHQRTLPYKMPHSNLVTGEHVGYELLDHTSRFASDCQFCPTDSTDYLVPFGNPYTIAINDTTGGYMKGTFDGVMLTKTGKGLIVKNGTFNIKVTRIKDF